MRRIDDLQLNDLKIIQETTAFCFGVDAVFLSDFASSTKGIKPNSKIIDLGCGNGIIPILLSQKIECFDKIIGVEIQAQAAKLAEENVKLNKLAEKIEIINGDLKSIKFDEKFDLVVSNPPYKPIGKGLKSDVDAKAIARNETHCNLEDVIKAANQCLKFQGKFCMVHKPERLSEIFELCIKYDLEPKRLKMLHSSIEKPPSLILIESSYKGNKGLIVEPPLVVGGI